MEKGFFIIFLFLSIIPVTTAVEIDMKTTFSQGETLMAKVSGNFYETISKEDIVFRKGHVRTSIIPFVTEIDNTFYIYAQLLDKTSGNYSITVENTKYFQGSQIIEEDLSKNFSINNDIADFSINPGFVVTNGDFFIEVRNLQDQEISIGSRISNESFGSGGFFENLFGGESGQTESLINLKSGETKKINFDVENIGQFSIIELSSENLEYEISVNIFSKEEIEDEKLIKLRFEPSELEFSMSTNSENSGIFYLRNTGEESVKKISLIVSESLFPYVTFSITEIDELKENSSERIDIDFYSDEETIVEGEIIAFSNETSASAFVYLNFLKDYIPVEVEEPEVETVPETCSELNGQICGENQQCGGDIKYATDGVCCIGTCTEIEESQTGKIIGWAILIFVFILVVWFYLRKYKSVKGVSNLSRILGRR